MCIRLYSASLALTLLSAASITQAASQSPSRIIVKHVPSIPAQQGAAQDGDKPAPIVVEKRLFELRPGYTEKVPVPVKYSKIYVGDVAVVDVDALTDDTCIIKGIKEGLTNVSFYNEERQEVANYSIRVNSFVGTTEVRIYNSKVLSNWISYACKDTRCDDPVEHQIKKEDLPKGYSADVSGHASAPSP